MHQQSAHCVHPETAGLVLSPVDPIREADPIGLLSLKRELRRVLQNQDRTGRRGKTAARRLKVTGENLLLADPVIGKEPTGRLGVGPILARQRMLAPMAPSIRSSSLCNRLFRRKHTVITAV